MTNPELFAAVFPNRLHYTTGPANGDYPLIRLCGPTVECGVDGDIPDPIPPTLGGKRWDEEILG